MNFSRKQSFSSTSFDRPRFYNPTTYSFIAFFIGMFGFGIGLGLGARVWPVITVETPSRLRVWCLLNPTHVVPISSGRNRRVDPFAFGRFRGKVQVVLHEDATKTPEQTLDAVRINFKTTYDTHQALTRAFEGGGLTQEGYENALKNNMFFYDEGWWTIGQTTGAWHVSRDGKTWRRTPSPFDDLNGGHGIYVDAEKEE